MPDGMRLGRRISRRGMMVGTVGTVVGAVGVLPAQCNGTIYPGVFVHGVDVSGMTAEDGEVILRDELAAFEDEAVTYRFGDRTWTARLADLGMEVDYDSMLGSAMAAVHDEGVLRRYTALVDGDERHEISLFLRSDATALDAYLAGIATEIAIEPRDARLTVAGGGIDIASHQTGQRLDVHRARTETQRVVRGGKPATIDLSVTTLQPEVLTADLRAQKEAAVRMVSEPVTFTIDDLEYAFDTDHLFGALTIASDNSVILDAAALETRIAQIEADAAREPSNVTLAWDGGLYVVEPDTPGRAVDREELLARLRAAAASDERIAPLPVVEVKAPARADNLDELGLEAHVGSGSSSFAGSSYERAVNVGVAAQNINYKLIAPGEEFSFNDLLGPISEENGYIAGSIIQGDFAATDIGGGVCQMSTTVFRAAQNAGFRFSEWNPHTWRLAFYEADGSSPGLDAAIYQPNSEWEYELDLRFVNPLDSWMLLMTIVDGDWVSAHFYGKDPGWTVEVYPARISEPKPIPDPVEKVNPALAPGERRLVGQPQPGYTVWVRRVVTAADGTVISDGDFVTDYLSQPEAWEVGPS